MLRTLQRGLLLATLLLSVAPCQATVYATWIMVWHGHDQAWWSANPPDGLKNRVNARWKALDWAANTLVEDYLDGIKQAGVEVVIADLSNGWNWLDGRCQFIQSVCARKGLKLLNQATAEALSLDVTAAGAPVRLLPPNSGGAQQWRLQPALTL